MNRPCDHGRFFLIQRDDWVQREFNTDWAETGIGKQDTIGREYEGTRIMSTNSTSAFILLPVAFTIVPLLLAGCSGNAVPLDAETSVQLIVPIDESAAVDDWPNLYGPSRNSTSSEYNLQLDFDSEGPPTLWTRKIGKGYGAPVTSHGKIILVSRNDDQEIIECCDSQTGNLIWDFRYSTDFQCSFEYSDGPYATPAIGLGKVFAVGAMGQFHCLDLETGQLIWARNPCEEYGVDLGDWPVTTSPVLANGKLVFNLGAAEQQAGIIALNSDDGSTIWEATDHHYSFATPVPALIQGRRLVFAMTFEGLVCLDPDTGSVYWEVAHRMKQDDRYNAVSPVVSGDRICIVTGPSVKPGFRCLQIQPDGQFFEPWKNIRLLNSQYTNLVVNQGFLYGFTPVKQGGPELVCIDLEKGKLAWKCKPGVGRGNLLAVQDRLLILGESGVLAAYKLSGESAEATFRTEQPVLKRPCYTSMALSGGLLYARNEKEVICLDLRQDSVGNSR